MPTTTERGETPHSSREKERCRRRSDERCRCQEGNRAGERSDEAGLVAGCVHSEGENPMGLYRCRIEGARRVHVRHVLSFQHRVTSFCYLLLSTNASRLPVTNALHASRHPIAPLSLKYAYRGCCRFTYSLVVSPAVMRQHWMTRS